MTTPKQVIRRFPPFASFQKFLVSETEVGNISRQEIVSMIPPLLLDVRPGMVVLDMCAAPGSKTAQIMEMLHAGEEERMEQLSHRLENGEAEAAKKEGTVDVPKLLDENLEADGFGDDGRSTGLLIANDSDYKRAHLLIHQLKRLNSPNLLVTNHDATMYPSIKLSATPATDGKPMRNRYLKFDRILADVPCSGDGTTRKNSNVWKDWNPANAIGLHPTQNRILVRALQLLKVGGRVVYSTCSMNPVENEAVIANVIDRCGGPSKVEIIDCSGELKGLIRSPGLMSWNVMDKQGRVWNNWKEVEEAISAGDESLTRLSESMFPPNGDSETLDLTRCMRVYPHQQDTGGFFITVLEKKGEIKAKPEGVQKTSSTKAKEQGPSTSPLKRGAEELESEPEAKRTKVSEDEVETPVTGDVTPQIEETKPAGGEVDAPVTGETTPQPKQAKPSGPQKNKSGQQFEEPFKYIESNNEEFDGIFKFYEISPRFPRDRFMVRNAEGRAAKTVYYTTVLAREILTENEGSGMKFVHCGVKMFVKQDVQREGVCPWRIQADGLPIIEPWIGKRRTVKAYKKETMRKLLVEMFPRVGDDGWKELGEIGEWARDIDMGCCVLKLEASHDEDGFPYVPV